MDAFFASIEQRDHPSLRGKPVAVGRGEARGVVAAASYEARKFGVHSAMPSVTAIRKCPGLIFMPPRFEVYHRISAQIMDIFHDFTDLVEPLSIDEAYLDVTQNKYNLPSATIIAQEVKHRIWQTTGLTASAGVSVNKFLAKVASGYQKPNGLCVIAPDEVDDFIARLPIGDFYGVGTKTAERMHELGIFNGRDLQQMSLPFLVRHFGKSGAYFFQIARGIDDRPVEPHRERKSVGIENTFERDLTRLEAVVVEVNLLIEGLWERVLEVGKTGRTLTLKVKYHNFEQVTRSRTLAVGIDRRETIQKLAYELLEQVDLTQSVRLLGLTVSNFEGEQVPQAIQLTIRFPEVGEDV